MEVWKKRAALYLAWSLVLSHELFAAQQLGPSRSRVSGQGSPHRVRARPSPQEDAGGSPWEYEVLKPLGSDRRRQKATTSCLANTMTNGFFATMTNGVEWVDWASKHCGAGLITRFVIGYATTAPSASLGIRFFTGTTGFCSRGQVAQLLDGSPAEFDFTGLPGVAGSPNAHFIVTIDLPSAVCLPDGKVGWGFSGNPFTGPLLTEFSSNTGWVDAYDLWTRPDEMGTCAGVFFFGGCDPPMGTGVCSGLFISLHEEAVVATVTSVSGNPARYSSLTRPILGTTWVNEIRTDCGNPNLPTGHAELAAILRIGAGAFSGGSLDLATVGLGHGDFLAPFSGRNTHVDCLCASCTIDVPIPLDLSLLGLSFHSQAFAVISTLGFTQPVTFQALNGFDAVVGTI